MYYQYLQRPLQTMVPRPTYQEARFWEEVGQNLHCPPYLCTDDNTSIPELEEVDASLMSELEEVDASLITQYGSD